MSKRSSLALLCLPLLLACQMPSGGTPVFVDMRAGDFWSGEAKLLEVSDDQQRCRVAVRSRSLVVRKRWVDCAYVHARSVDHRATAPVLETSPKSTFK
jgi:hypothetical protein